MTLWIGQAVDPNAGLTERADFFAMATVGLHVPTRRFYLLDMLHSRFDTTLQPHKVTEEYAEWANRPGCTYYRCGIQTIFYESDLYRHLHNDGIVPLKEIARRRGTGTAGMNKQMICLGLAGRWERGQIILPGEGGLESEGGRGDYESNPWLSKFIEELMSIGFVAGKEKHAHDDMVEAVALCVEMLAELLASGQFEEPIYHGVEMDE